MLAHCSSEYLSKPLNTDEAISISGGRFPVVHGRKYDYPDPSNKRAWTNLINEARLYRLKEIRHIRRYKDKELDYKLRHVPVGNSDQHVQTHRDLDGILTIRETDIHSTETIDVQLFLGLLTTSSQVDGV